MSDRDVISRVHECIEAILNEARELGLQVGTGVKVLKDGRCYRCIVPSAEGSSAKSLLAWAHPPCEPGKIRPLTPEAQLAMDNKVREWCVIHRDTPTGRSKREFGKKKGPA
ncbi:MAG: hypothetical protein WC712_05195 [Candidatus Brocadiia bacterium]